jgi:[acyl-carrier-protein] S-malonyltransferase
MPHRHQSDDDNHSQGRRTQRVTVAVIFPGQGTQEPGMGAPWRDHPAWEIVDRAETALGEPIGELILDAPADRLARTREAQLAVLLTSLIAWEAARETVSTPVGFAGHSLGQVTALIAGGALSVEDGVRFAARRAELTQQAADAHPGRMAALLGATLEQAEDACGAAPDACWIANDNAPGQVVVAGTPDGVEATTARAKELGVKRAMPLNVGGAFHTPLMRDARDALAKDVLPDVQLSVPDAPIVSNHDGAAYDDADGWRTRLPEHVSVPVRWRPSVETLAALGATQFVEVGHGSMLAALGKRIAPDLPVHGIATPSDLPSPSEVR